LGGVFVNEVIIPINKVKFFYSPDIGQYFFVPCFKNLANLEIAVEQ
jgi:hypothetical protein